MQMNYPQLCRSSRAENGMITTDARTPPEQPEQET
jgi:hypothetical protein